MFDRCRIHSKAAGYVTAQSKIYAAQASAYIIRDSHLTGFNTGAGVYLGRPWRPYADVIYLNCLLDSHIRPEGWLNWSGTDNYLTATYAEYNSTGPGANPSMRVSWSSQLAAGDIAPFDVKTFLAGADGWDPAVFQPYSVSPVSNSTLR